MYRPSSFKLTDVELIREVLEEWSFATLVTCGSGGMQASHLPFEYEPDANVLRTHLARANPQWREFGMGEVLAIFQGPHGYISPRWYENPLSVPTWNYVAVHVYGTVRIVEDDSVAAAVLERLVARNESNFENPWRLEAPEDWQAKMRAAIVVMEIEISRIEAKAKLSQNRPSGDVDRAIEGLDERGESALAEWMRRVRA